MKGAHEISDQTEFNFVLQTARVFRRMGEYCQFLVKLNEFIFRTGCHVLALALVKTWKFERLTLPSKRDAGNEVEDLISPLPSMRPSLNFGKHTRRASILIDMDVPSDPSTRAASPSQEPPTEANGADQQKSPSQKKTGLGNLMKSAKQDVNVPEFDMNAFF